MRKPIGAAHINRQALRAMVNEALDLEVRNSQNADVFSALIRCIAYTLGAEYHVGYDRPRNEAWFGAFHAVRDIIIESATADGAWVDVDAVTDRLMGTLANETGGEA